MAASYPGRPVHAAGLDRSDIPRRSG